MSGEVLGLAKSKPISQLLLEDKQRLAELLHSLEVTLFEYFPREDVLLLYGESLEISRRYDNYLARLEHHSHLRGKDQPKLRALLQRQSMTSVEVCLSGEDGSEHYAIISLVSSAGANTDEERLVGTIKDITREKERENFLRERAYRDSMTSLYNRSHGQRIVDEYLHTKGPFASCGMMVIDIDFFKNVNDTYGHLFGDKVLIEMAKLLRGMFDREGIVIRAGGDEFVVFLQNISHTALIHKTASLLDAVRALTFPENDYAITCSIGVCFLPENTFGYGYQQLFADADWALYRAKKFGRNRYEFCDDLQRFEMESPEKQRRDADIDERYLRNDVVSTAFEIFEKTANFDAAMRLLLKVVGLRLQLDRITVIRTDTRERTTGRDYQWTAPGAPEVLHVEASFTKEDFLTLFHSYDAYGTTVLHYDNMSMYSEGAQALLMQGGAKTVVYAAMYCEGHYSGAVSYVTCDAKRHWTSFQRCQLGELTKIISAHMAKSRLVNDTQISSLSASDYDSLTGLLSFSRFREETERIIVGRTDESYVIVYSDFENFKYLNQKYGYRQGDQLLKEFAGYIIGTLRSEENVYFTRVVADQFVLFMPCEPADDLDVRVHAINEEFSRRCAERFPEFTLRIRSGFYLIDADCSSASAAIDAANYARRQVRTGAAVSACAYSKKLEEKQLIETEIINGITDALKNQEFKAYLQPKFSIKDGSIVGAEALVRWQRPDGRLLMPGDFIPLYEQSGRILELDFYMFEQVTAFLAKNDRLGRRQVPISINASILHASHPDTIQRYLNILKKYNVDPSLTEIELTETATATEFEGIIHLFRQFQEANIPTSLDDFGAGYSVLNALVDIPVNTVKIDRVFLNCCESNEKGIYFLRQIVAMLKSLGYKTLCEGIETERQLEILRDAGCEVGQGFFFARPLPLEEYEKLVYGE